MRLEGSTPKSHGVHDFLNANSLSHKGDKESNIITLSWILTNTEELVKVVEWT